MKKVLLAMSGGVDSSAAVILLREHYEVIGVTFDFCGIDVDGVKKIAEQFNIKHYVFDYRREFIERVIEPFNQAWLNGETPNPCTHCNRYMKFDVLMKHTDELGCDYMATGHYARVENGILKKGLIKSAGTNNKDQSYMLYNLSKEMLSKLVLPLGNMSKSAVRELAGEHGLLNADKPDSQDICFIPDGDYAAFIGENCDVPEGGDFLDMGGRVIGRHKGHIHYTVGQRRGLELSNSQRLYVIGKDARDNTVTLGEESELFLSEFKIKNSNLPVGEFRCCVKIRYSQNDYPCVVKDGNVILDVPQKAITAGQCAVFYKDEVVLGGGIIV
ncbi:MAG: tRNA 2-thiouridine(34) synthase MnmA [Oscillospiraceae bacterium]|nr:tRNA 2-thiouridine(34) synthase MnmA [Oscillospiraceae bacterium]